MPWCHSVGSAPDHPTGPDSPPVDLFDSDPRDPAAALTGPIQIDVLTPATDTPGLVAFWRDRARDAERDALDARARVVDLERTIEVNRDIERVTGVLTVVFDVGPEAVTDVLSWISGRTGAPLHVVARQLVDGARSLDYGDDPAEELTLLIADLAGRRPGPAPAEA